MNPKQKKLLLVAGIAVAIWYIAPTFIYTARQQAFIRQQQAAQLAKAQAAKAAQQAAPPPTLPASPATPQANNLFGIWQGMGIVDRLGNCNMKLGLRSAAEPGQITGYPVMVCVPIPIISSGPKTLAQFTPASAVLTGKPGDKSVDFTVDKTTSKGKEAIAHRAYELYVQRRGAPGNATEDWLKAERQLSSSQPSHQQEQKPH